MKIPRKLKIGAHTVKVREVEMIDDTRCCGDSSYTNGEIRINKDLSQTQKESTLIHEILYFCNTTLDHALLDSLAEQLYQALKDNKMLK